MASKVLQNALWGPPLAGAIFGLGMTWASTTTITVGTGFATDSTNQRTMKLATALTKSTSAWAAGNAGGLDTGTIAANTGYHWYEIFNLTTGAVDIVYSATATPLAGPALMPSGYTHFRWIWWTKTNGSSQWYKFIQNNDESRWDVPAVEASPSVVAGTPATVTLTGVPLGLKVEAILMIGLIGATVGTFVLPSAIASTAAGLSNAYTLANVGNSQSAIGGFRIPANTAGQIQVTVNNPATVAFNTEGWRIPNRIAA